MYREKNQRTRNQGQKNPAHQGRAKRNNLKRDQAAGQKVNDEKKEEEPIDSRLVKNNLFPPGNAVSQPGRIERFYRVLKTYHLSLFRPM